jgi:hypothetical protein
VNTEVESEQQNRTAYGDLARVLLEYSCRKAQIKDIDLVPAIPYANKCADKIKL